MHHREHALESVAKYAPQRLRAAFVALVVALTMPACPAAAEDWVHAIAMHGKPALAAGFAHFPYVRPDAPKGGTISYGVVGTFDSLNPFILKSMRTTARGVIDPQFGNLVFESLMTRSRDEAFSLYGHLADKVRMPDDRSWIEFSIDADAKWSDGAPVTPEDVIFTFGILAEKGRPPFNARMKKIAAIEKTGERTVKFTFNAESDREFPLIVALNPILPRHATNRDTFADSTLTPMTGSGPYRIDKVDAGQRIVYEKNPDWWAKDRAAMAGQFNFDRISVEYFSSGQTQFEAFKKGLFDIHAESDPAKWDRAYDFPAVAQGLVRKETFEQGLPANMYGFVFNTRRPVFANRAVRQGLSLAFDFEAVNKSLFFGVYRRTASFWHGSALSALGRPADASETALIARFPGAVDAATLAGDFAPPVTDGSGRDRKVLKAANDLLLASGYMRKDSRLVDVAGVPLAFEILTRSTAEEKLALAFARSLEALGVAASIRTVDDAQYQQRLQNFDYDMILGSYGASLSPGIEQSSRWGSASRDTPGSFNYAGAADPAIDAAIDAILGARDADAFASAVRALDRLLMAGHYVAPLYHLPQQWVASWTRLGHPRATPLYGYYLPAWWEEKPR
jgi:peptide/nickel transport system substrate-binding protein